MNTGCIYIIKNFNNNKIYIGKTLRSDGKTDAYELAQQRFNEHCREAFNENSKAYDYCISRAIRKYGTQSFDFAVLAENVEEDKIMIVEEHYIDMYNTTDINVGYNMSPGGNKTDNHEYYREQSSGEEYSDNTKVNIDDISNEDIEQFLKEL